MTDKPDSSVQALLVSGPDAESFLQGQLSNDMAALQIGAYTLAGLHSPQGRVIALLKVYRETPTSFRALLPAEMIDLVATRLQRFVLRSKVAITRPSSLPEAVADAMQSRAARIAAGLPQVYLATTELFVAQMLNLDLIGAVSFTKGCYTGQEVIARAHYRGRVKRRMQRFVCPEPCRLAPGEQCRLQDGRNAQIVDVAPPVAGRTEFLAVTTLASDESSDTNHREETATATATTAIAARPVQLHCAALDLPYPLPAATA